MSASREKKQRQGVGPTEQDIQAQEKAVAYKKKVRLYTTIGAVIAVLVAALLIWDSGVFQRNQTAAIVGDTKYSVNDVNYFYQSARYNTFMYYYYFGIDAPSDDDVMDSESGQTYREYFMEQTLQSMKEITALYDEALANGWTEKDVADTVQEQIDSTKSSASSYGYSYAAYLKTQYGNYMTKSAFKSILTKVALADAYATDYSENTIVVTDEEIQAYYEENTDSLDSYTYSTLLFAPEEVATTDEDGNDLGLSEETIAAMEGAAMEEALANADAALAELQAGATIAELAEQYGLEESDVEDNVTAVGSSLSSAYSEDMFLMADGDMTVVEYSTYGYYVIALHQRQLVEEAAEGETEPQWVITSDTALRTEKSTAWLDELAGQYSAELASGSKYVAN